LENIIIIFIVFLIIILIIIGKRRGGRGFPWYDFYSSGKKEGFTFKEIGFLKKIALQNKLEKPQSIFWSTKQLDRCLRPAIQKINANEDMSPEYKLDIIKKLLELRKKAELNLPKYQKRIRDTKALLPRQKLIIRDRVYGTFKSWVIEINNKFLVVSQPSGQKGWRALNWNSHKIGVYFWRQDDAGYFFETRVNVQVTHEEFPLLYLAHSNNLKRIQKRESIRVITNIRTRYYPVAYSTTEGKSRAFITKKGYSANIIDLSETGCCMIAGKMLKKNDRLKIDFFITDEKRVVVLGIVVNVSKTGDERVKKYHIMFLKIGPLSRNNVLLYVYNIFGERMEKEKKENKKSVVPVKPVDNMT